MNWSTSDAISVLALIASVVSAGYARKTYMATEALKVHDFALELQRSISTLRALLADLPRHLNWTGRSHKGVLNATGNAGGSVWKQWEKKAIELTAEIASIEKRVPSEDVKGLGLTELRELIANVHGLQVRATAIKADLDEILERDEMYRAELREDERSGKRR